MPSPRGLLRWQQPRDRERWPSPRAAPLHPCLILSPIKNHFLGHLPPQRVLPEEEAHLLPHVCDKCGGPEVRNTHPRPDRPRVQGAEGGDHDLREGTRHSGPSQQHPHPADSPPGCWTRAPLAWSSGPSTRGRSPQVAPQCHLAAAAVGRPTCPQWAARKLSPWSPVLKTQPPAPTRHMDVQNSFPPLKEINFAICHVLVFCLLPNTIYHINLF